MNAAVPLRDQAEFDWGYRRLLGEVLRPEQRDAVLGSHVAGYTAAELSAAAAVPLGTMKSHIRAGLRRLESVAA